MEKAERVNRIRNSLDSEDELVRRLPEIDAIYDDEIRQCVIDTYMKGCPDYFWTHPTSSTGKYHSPDERGKCGNWIHTKRVFSKYCSLSHSYWEAGELSDYERDCGKAAALIHDMMKYGWPSEGRDHTTSEHDVIAAEVARDIGGCPSEVWMLVHAHMGPWGEGKLPETQKEWLLHFADKAAADIDEDDLAVYYPAREILEEVPDINIIDHEDGEII